eukprot:6077441-Prymnesium_polylepis.1
MRSEREGGVVVGAAAHRVHAQRVELWPAEELLARQLELLVDLRPLALKVVPRVGRAHVLALALGPRPLVQVVAHLREGERGRER